MPPRKTATVSTSSKSTAVALAGRPKTKATISSASRSDATSTGTRAKNSKGNKDTPAKAAEPRTASKRKHAAETSAQAKKAKTDKTPVESLPIPKTIKDFTDADRMLYDSRKAGKGWKEIGIEWERMTGQKASATTLPNRFTRIRENIGDFNDHDDELLLKCKKELEDTWAQEVWAMVSEQLVNKGGEKHTAASLEKRFRELTGAIKVEDDEEADNA